MGGKSSRSKGSNAELEIMKMIRDWWVPVEPEAQWARVPLSGGWGTPTQRKGFKACGDIMTSGELFPFTVEVKRREGWVVSNVMAGKKSPVWSWWKQAVKQGKEADLMPMLVFRKSYMEWLCMVEVSTLINAETGAPVIVPREKPTDTLHIVRVFPLKDFLSCNPQEILEINEQKGLCG